MTMVTMVAETPNLALFSAATAPRPGPLPASAGVALFRDRGEQLLELHVEHVGQLHQRFHRQVLASRLDALQVLHRTGQLSSQLFLGLARPAANGTDLAAKGAKHDVRFEVLHSASVRHAALTDHQPIGYRHRAPSTSMSTGAHQDGT